MTLYVDSSAFAKRYLPEPEHDTVLARMHEDGTWVSARHTLVEVHRVLARLGSPGLVDQARSTFDGDWANVGVIEIDQATCSIAVEIATTERVRTLDALHLAAAWRSGSSALKLLTYDRDQARAAQNLGMAVVPI